MSAFERFMKGNKIRKESTVDFAATKSLTDENGNPLIWKLKYISTTELERIRADATYEEQIPGKFGQVRERLKEDKFNADLMCAAIAYPDLRNEELQDSYGVTTPGDLLKEMIDNPGEYTRLQNKITEMNGFDETFEEKVDFVKN